MREAPELEFLVDHHVIEPAFRDLAVHLSSQFSFMSLHVLKIVWPDSPTHFLEHEECKKIHAKVEWVENHNEDEVPVKVICLKF